MADIDRPLEINSDDVDTSKFTLDAFKDMRRAFPGTDDLTLARFLVARNGDVSKASALLTKHLDWKSKNLPIVKAQVANEFNKGKFYARGFDKEGHPIMIWHARLNNPKERDVDEMGRMICWWMEYIYANMPANKSKITILLDRSDFKNENNDIEFTRHLSTFFQDNYPETLHRCVVYPSGLVFYGVWNIVKWFLDPVTQAKVQPVLQYAGVQQFVSDDNIPASMGGQSTYTFNPNDYQDPYPPEVVAEAQTHPSLAHFEDNAQSTEQSS